MSCSYTIDKEEGVLVAKFLSPPSLADYCAAMTEIGQHHNNLLRLWDMSSGFDMASSEIATMAEFAKQRLSLPGSKVAVYAPDDLAFGLFRVNQVYRDSDLVEYQVFRSREQAMEWLKS